MLVPRDQTLRMATEVLVMAALQSAYGAKKCTVVIHVPSLHIAGLKEYVCSAEILHTGLKPTPSNKKVHDALTYQKCGVCAVVPQTTVVVGAQLSQEPLYTCPMQRMTSMYACGAELMDMISLTVSAESPARPENKPRKLQNLKNMQLRRLHH